LFLPTAAETSFQSAAVRSPGPAAAGVVRLLGAWVGVELASAVAEVALAVDCVRGQEDGDVADVRKRFEDG
jgi:xanthosine utilization system XapX-like protein